MTRAPGRVRVSGPVTPPGHNGIRGDRGEFLDFYGALAHFADTTVSNYETVFAARGYRPERAVLDGYFARYDGVDHAEQLGQ